MVGLTIESLHGFEAYVAIDSILELDFVSPFSNATRLSVLEAVSGSIQERSVQLCTGVV